jgi:ribosome-binding protein aMBF1 (putative translation factor)
MLVLVKKPRIELSIHGEGAEHFLAWIRKKYKVSVLSADAEESVPIEDTGFWREMQANRVGNLLAAARLKAALTQAHVARKLGIRQNMVSDYERGRRQLSPAMAKRFSDVLHVKEAHLRYGGASRAAAQRRKAGIHRGP